MLDIRKSVLAETICEQIRFCFMNLMGLISCKGYYLLKLEVKHFDLLLDVLSMKNSIEAYLDSYYSLFPSTEEYDFTCNYLPQISTLEKREESYIHLSDKALCFVEILKICSDNIKKYMEHGNYESIKDEIYYNHNVPSLVTANKDDLVKYYLDIECNDFKKNCSKEIVQPYEAIWIKLND